MRHSSRAERLRRARSHLREADPVLAQIIDARPNFDPRAWIDELPPMDLYGALLFQVTGQQLSVAATRHTIARIEQLFAGRLPSPAELLATDPATLREAGLSWRKVNTLRDLAERMSDGRLNTDVLSRKPDDEIIAELTAIPGIGPWTVQGALIVALNREDIVLAGDLALRKQSETPTISTVCRRSRRFSPSPRSGGPIAVSPRATCSPQRSSRTTSHTSPRARHSTAP
jgi:DNA-3-methyladenine glycosylase II